MPSGNEYIVQEFFYGVDKKKNVMIGSVYTYIKIKKKKHLIYQKIAAKRETI